MENITNKKQSSTFGAHTEPKYLRNQESGIRNYFLICCYLLLCSFYSYGASSPKMELTLPSTDRLSPSVISSMLSLCSLLQLIKEGDQYHNQKNYFMAIAYYQKAVTNYTENYSEKSMLLAMIYNKLGMSCLGFKIYAQSYFYLHQALTIAEGQLSIATACHDEMIYKPISEFTVESYHNLGLLYLAIDNPKAATLSFTAALTIKSSAVSIPAKALQPIGDNKLLIRPYLQESVSAPLSSSTASINHNDNSLVSNNFFSSLSNPLSGTTFGISNDLASQPSAITKEDALSCDRSGQRVIAQKALITHLRMHKEKKSFLCPVCNKTFTQKANMKAHFRVHTGEKPFPCPMCHKSFSAKHNMKAHLRVHTGEKPFSCPLCQKKFSQKEHMKKHIKCIHKNQVL